MRAIFADVVDAAAITSEATRYGISGGMSVDLPHRLFAVAVGDRLKIQAHAASEEAAEASCLMNGQVYDHADGFTFVSCGGLLHKLALGAQMLDRDVDVSVAISKSRRRRRNE